MDQEYDGAQETEHQSLIRWKWYDLWVGVFIDVDKRIVYFCPFPTIVIEMTYILGGLVVGLSAILLAIGITAVKALWTFWSKCNATSN